MGILAICLLFMVLPPQDKIAGESAPLGISNNAIVQGMDGRDEIQLSLTNRASKQIVAYALMVTLSDGTGQPFATVMIRNVFVDDEESASSAQSPGNVWQVRAHLPRLSDGSIPPYSVDVDYVSFSDGTSWGMDRSNSGPYINGFREGTRILKGKLRDKLENEGSEAVKAYLRRK
jgi:hypothetical protein